MNLFRVIKGLRKESGIVNIFGGLIISSKNGQNSMYNK